MRKLRATNTGLKSLAVKGDQKWVGLKSDYLILKCLKGSGR